MDMNRAGQDGWSYLLCAFSGRPAEVCSPAKKVQIMLRRQLWSACALQFIDLCILLGCDYCGSIRGIGPKRAIDLIRQHRSLEQVLRNIDTDKYPPPENWDYQRARELFLEPEVTDPKEIELRWSDPDEEGLVKFLCGDKQFNEERVRNGAKKLMKARSGTTQGRLDGFFTISTTPNPKRKAEEDKKNSAKKKAKTGGGGGKGRKPK